MRPPTPHTVTHLTYYTNWVVEISALILKGIHCHVDHPTSVVTNVCCQWCLSSNFSSHSFMTLLKNTLLLELVTFSWCCSWSLFANQSPPMLLLELGRWQQCSSILPLCGMKSIRLLNMYIDFVKPLKCWIWHQHACMSSTWLATLLKLGFNNVVLVEGVLDGRYDGSLWLPCGKLVIHVWGLEGLPLFPSMWLV